MKRAATFSLPNHNARLAAEKRLGASKIFGVDKVQHGVFCALSSNCVFFLKTEVTVSLWMKVGKVMQMPP